MTTTAAPPHRTRRILGISLVVVAVLLVAAAAFARRVLDSPSDQPAAVGVTDLRVVDGAFEPPVVRVDAGQELTWTFAGDEGHNVVFADGSASPVRSDGTWSHTPTATGVHDYRCTLHFGMRGRVEVVAS